MKNLIIVGIGDHYKRFLSHTFSHLQEEGIIELVASVDLKESPSYPQFPDKKHFVRKPGQKLSSLLESFKKDNPIIVLAHSNEEHYNDLEDLVLNGYNVMLEKPYVTNKEDLEKLRKLLFSHKRQIFLLDSYLLRKFSPAALLLGKISPNSFYRMSEKVFKLKEDQSIPFQIDPVDLLSEIGLPKKAKFNLLESEKLSSNMALRGGYLYDRKRGGGMIADLLLHAISPIIMMQEYVGEIDLSFGKGSLRVARCNQFREIAEKIHGLNKQDIAETAVKIDFSTNKGIPVEINLGKYISKENNKYFKLEAERGGLLLDMEDNFLELHKEGSVVQRIDLVNQKSWRYYGVIRTGLDFFDNLDHYNLDINDTLLKSQEFALNVGEKISDLTEMNEYSSGEEVEDIFRGPSVNDPKIAGGLKNLSLVVTSPSFSKKENLVRTAKEIFPSIKLNSEGYRYSKEEMIDLLKDADAAIVGLERIDEEILSECPNLKVIAKYGVGLDNVDLEACKERKISVLWTPGTNKLSVAEITLSNMISLMRNLSKTSLELKAGIWKKEGGRNLSRKTIGIIGAGNIGKEVIRLLKPFKCRILVNDIKDLSAYCKGIKIEFVDKERIWQESDIVTIHTPLTELTSNLINKEVLSKMKQGSFIINTSRGGIVNESDLYEAIINKKISGAALDVYEEEPPINNNLIKLSEVICTPHIGGNSEESINAMGLSALENLVNYYRNEFGKRP